MSLTKKALFVIERNSNRELAIKDIAEACEVSPFHLAHAFGEATGVSVMEYVRGPRLSEAAHALASGAGGILGVALDYGYGSHEAFSRAFKARFGQTPDEVRRAGTTKHLAVVEPIQVAGESNVKLATPRIETAGELKFAGLSEPLSYESAGHIPGQWQRFMRDFYADIENKLPSPPVGVSMQGDLEGELRYVCAAEVSRFGAVPSALVKVTVPPATYAVFAHDGHVMALQSSYVAIWNDWFPESGRIPAEAPTFQRHNETFDPRTGNGGVTIWIPLAV